MNKKLFVGVITILIVYIMSFSILMIRNYYELKELNEDIIDSEEISSDVKTPIKHHRQIEDASGIVENDQGKSYGNSHGSSSEDVYIDKSNQLSSDGEQITDTQYIQQSPFGLGSFPDIPPDYPYLDNWDFYASEDRLIQPDDYDISHLNISWDTFARNSELIARTRVKLWERGKDAPGAAMDPSSGLIYPQIPGVAYIEYSIEKIHKQMPDGSVIQVGEGERYISSVSGNISEFEQSEILDGRVPSGVKMYTIPDGGIDPYQFLNLQN